MFNEASSHWDTLSNTEKTVGMVRQLVTEVPLPYKGWFTNEDLLMVVGGLKGAADMYILKDQADAAELGALRQGLSRAGLCLLESSESPELPADVDVESFGEGPLYQLVIYNPGTIARETQNSDLVPPYDQKEDLATYIRRARKQGVELHVIEGKVFSFPESAIKDFGKPGEIHTVGSQGETYYYTNEPQPDVIEREQAKEKFFSDIKDDAGYQQLLSSPILAESKAEWKRRASEMLEKFKSGKKQINNNIDSFI